jgi:putative ABC transport system substrate-binding protein
VELVGLAPDVILASGFSTIRPLLDGTRNLPIVFVNVVDPVGGGLVASLARPGGNITGFTTFEFGISIKWLELLKQIAPGVTRAAVLRDPTITAIILDFRDPTLPMCTENSVLIDSVTEAPNVGGDDRSCYPPS